MQEPEDSHILGAGAYKLGFKTKYQGREQVEKLIALEYLMSLHAEEPNLTSDQLVRELQAFHDEYDRRVNQGIPESHETYRDVFEWVVVGLEGASAIPKYGPIIGAVGKSAPRLAMPIPSTRQKITPTTPPWRSLIRRNRSGGATRKS